MEYLTLAKYNLTLFQSEKELEEYIAFLFSQLSLFSSGWKELLDAEQNHLTGNVE